MQDIDSIYDTPESSPTAVEGLDNDPEQFLQNTRTEDSQKTCFIDGEIPVGKSGNAIGLTIDRGTQTPVYVNSPTDTLCLEVSETIEFPFGNSG